MSEGRQREVYDREQESTMGMPSEERAVRTIAHVREQQ